MNDAEENGPGLVKKVTKWVNKQGYRLEHKVKRTMAQEGLGPFLSIYVPSAKGDKYRQIDVKGARSKILHLKPEEDELHGGMGQTLVEVNWICECKYSKGTPWLLLRSDAPADPRYDLELLPASSDLRDLLFPGGLTHLNMPIAIEGTWHLRQPDKGIGYQLLQAMKESADNRGKNDNRDRAFETVRGLATICDDYMKWWQERMPVDRFFSLCIPCLVVDGPLFMADFNAENDEFEVAEIKYSRLKWSGSGETVMIDIVGAEHCGLYAAELKQFMDHLLDAIAAKAEDRYA